MEVGIDNINVYMTPLVLNTETLAKARNIGEKMVEDVGFNARSIVPCYEDAVTQAVNAAQAFIDQYNRDDIQLLIAGTESNLDSGKPISTYIHKYLDLNPHCLNFDIKHACFSGTAALNMAKNWLKAQEDPNAKVLVIMSDLSRPHLEDSAEITSGSGAIAMMIAADPKVLVLDEKFGCGTQEVFDVARPTPFFEWGDPVLSLYSYLDLAESAWEDYQSKTKSQSIEDDFQYMLYHIPLISLAQKTHEAILENCNDEVSKEEILGSFQQMVAPSLDYNRELSNIYSGSLYLSLLGLIDKHPDIKTDTHIGLFSYGSGACAELFAGRTTENSYHTIHQHHIADRLADRHNLSFEEYVSAVKTLEKALTTQDFQPDYNQFPNVYENYYQGKHRLVLDKIDNYHKLYKWS